MQNPEWGFYIESSATTAFRSRIRLLNEVSRERILTLAYHEQYPGLGYVSTLGPFYDWIPVPLRIATF